MSNITEQLGSVSQVQFADVEFYNAAECTRYHSNDRAVHRVKSLV